MPTEPKLPVIQVCGDPTVDWLSVRNADMIERGGAYFWTADYNIPTVGQGSQIGGSALLLELIRRLVSDQAVVLGADLDYMLLKLPQYEKITNTWTSWSAYIDKKSTRMAFRLNEWQGFEYGRWDYEENRLTGRSDMLVIDDSGLAFRDIEAGWPDSLVGKAEPPQCILMKLAKFGGDARSTEKKKAGPAVSGEISENPLLKRIRKLNLGGRTTIVVALNDLIACAVKIGESLSWETLFDEIVNAVHSPQCPFVNPQSKALDFARVIVTINTSGAVIVEDDRSMLIFDKSGQSGDFSGNEGEIMGLNTSFMGALAAHWSEHRNGMDWGKAALDGIGLARCLFTQGYEFRIVGEKEANIYKLQFPLNQIIKEYEKRKTGKSNNDKNWNLGLFQTSDIRGRSIGGWSILEETIKSRSGEQAGISNVLNAVTQCAADVVVRGPAEALPDIPVETVGNWRSADREEIEGVRNVKNAIRRYLAVKNQSTPLCIGVFGPPGAGKSFAIKELAKELNIDSQFTFNLSQFVSSDELIAAFHQIRDSHVKGKMPLVFWDEFDSYCGDKQLGWLKYFLAPMQDGEFNDHGRTHPIGGGIYIFAGATCYSYEEFRNGTSKEEIFAKKPDFISRLKVYLNIKGINSLPNSIMDKNFIVRRAFLLNSLLERYARNIKTNSTINIDSGALLAFLRVSEYKNGARSMETILKMSSLSGKRKYELSCLPSVQDLDMHVNARNFLSLVSYGHHDMLYIGITGHIGLDPSYIDRLKQGIVEAILFIQANYPNRALTVFSPMALGADRLVARILLQDESAGLIAVLPMTRDEYANDFVGTDDHNLRFINEQTAQQDKYANAYKDAEMRQEFFYWLDNRAIEVIELPPTATRDEAYLQAGYFVAEYSDLLFAVWDGHPAQGTGGTGDVVQKALECGKPVVHVWAGNYKENPARRTDVGEKLGTFRYKNIQGIKDNWED